MTSLFQGSPTSATSYTTSTSETPKWMQDAIYNQIQWAQNIANTPYAPYELPTVAEMSPLQQQAITQAQDAQGAWRPGLDAARTGFEGASTATSVDNVQRYLNPHTEAVTNRIAQLGQRNLAENLLPAISDQFIRAGQFGSAGMGDFGARALRDVNESILGQQASALQSGYTQALGASAADLARQQSALTQMANVAGQEQQLQTADIGLLSAAGKEQQQQQQAQLTAAQQQYEKELLYPRQQMDWLSTQIRGLAPITPTTSTQVQQTTGNTGLSPLSQLASAGAAAAGLYKMANP